MRKRFRIQFALRLLLLLATVLLAGYLVLRTQIYEGWIALGLLTLYQVVALVRYVEKWHRDLTRFLESVRYEDFSQHFRSDGRGPLFGELSRAFEEVTAEFRRIRAEREEHARYLQNVVRHVGVALLSYRTDGHVALVNDAAKRLLDVRRLRTIQELRPFSAELVETLLEMESGKQALVRVEREEITFQLAIYITRFKLRGRSYALASVQDIRGELEEHEMDAWQRLTRVLTHEIMNSVAPISSLANRLVEENGTRGTAVTSKQERAAQAIKQRSEALVNFVASYRSFMKVPAPEVEIVGAEELLHRVRRLLSAQIEAQRLRCRIRIEPAHLKLTADPELIEQVLINLLLNAIQAVEGRPEPCIGIRAYIDRRSRPAIEVTDNGPGIPSDVQEQIFIPFFTTKEEGSGIGLSLSRQIMRRHGGTLTARSDPGAGATFTLRF